MGRVLRVLLVLLASGLAGLSAAAFSANVPIPAGFGPRDTAVPAFPGGTRLTDEPGAQVVQIITLPPGPAPAPPIIDPLPPAPAPAPPIIDPLPPAPPVIDPLPPPPAPAPPPLTPTTTVTSTTENSTSTSTTVTTSSTTAASVTTSTTLAGCVAAATFPSVDCRLSEAIGQADAGQDGAVKDALLKLLDRAKTKASEASTLISSGSAKKGKTRLGAAIRKLKKAAALLESKRGKRAFDDATRTALGADVEAIRNDLVTLRND